MVLNFPWDAKRPRRLYITAEDTEFDATTIQHWKDEGFDVTYVPYDGEPKSLQQQLHKIGDSSDLGEKWGLIGWLQNLSSAAFK